MKEPDEGRHIYLSITGSPAQGNDVFVYIKSQPEGFVVTGLPDGVAGLSTDLINDRAGT